MKKEDRNKIEPIWFIGIGLLNVCVDFGTYFCLIQIGFSIPMAKGIGFLLGAISAYFANRKFTFRSERKGKKPFILFCFLYVMTFVTNVSLNSLLVLVFIQFVWGWLLAYLVTTAITATINFSTIPSVVKTFGSFSVFLPPSLVFLASG